MSDALLPKFDNPPVVEVALSISFESLDAFRSAHAGMVWRRIKDRFPVITDQHELLTVIEEPGVPEPPLGPRIEIQRPRLRSWFQNSEGTQLLQLQHNRLAYNWKQGPQSEPYPSFDEVEQHFRELVPIVMDVFDEEGLGTISPTQAEVTYVNHIFEPHRDIARVFSICSGWKSGAFLPNPEDARFTTRYVIPDETGNMVGRLTTEVQPAYITSTRAEILNLNLVARGKPGTSDVASALAFLRLGHEWIVRGFTEITTPEMHTKWKRTQ